MTDFQSTNTKTGRRSRRVLVLDDDAVARMIISRWFDRWRISYDLFASPTEVMSRLSANPYQLALLDYHLPRMSGLDLMAEMRNAAIRYNYQPPVFAIHTTDPDVRIPAHRANSDWFLLKPVKPEMLFNVLAQSGCAPMLPETQPIAGKLGATPHFTKGNEVKSVKI